jgi:hypothetical protein
MFSNKKIILCKLPSLYIRDCIKGTSKTDISLTPVVKYTVTVLSGAHLNLNGKDGWFTKLH